MLGRIDAAFDGRLVAEFVDDRVVVVEERSGIERFRRESGFELGSVAGASGTGLATRGQVEDAARRIYAEYPEILQALGL